MCDPACIDFGIKYLSSSDISNKDIIEVGSYDVNGSLRYPILTKNPKKYIGVDIVQGPGVDQLCDSYDIINHYGKESFDILISTEMLEHVQNWKLVISNFKNIIRPDGIIIITTRSRGFSRHNYPFDFWRFEVEDMKHIFSDFIINNVETDPYGPGVFIKATKPKNFIEISLDNYEVFDINKE